MTLVDDRLWSLFKLHWPQTLTYWSVFFSFGLCIAFLGPTILDLRCQTQSSLQQIIWVFFFQQFFLLVGSGLGGLFKKTLLSCLSALFSCTLTISIVFTIIPLCHDVMLLSIAMAVIGVAMGIIDTISNLQLVKLFQKDSNIFLQTLHFFIGLGALVSPLVADPFLSDDNCIVMANRTGNASSSDMEHLRSTLSGHSTGLHNMSMYPLHTEGLINTNVSYAFWIMALINLPVPAAVLVLMYHERLLPCCRNSPRLTETDRDSLASTSNNTDSGQGQHSVFGCCSPDKLRGQPATFFVLHVLGGAILFITDGIIGSYSGFVYTYAVSPPLLMAHRTAGYLESVFWAAITLGRLVFICLSCKYTAPVLLIFTLMGIVAVQCFLMIFYTSPVFLFFGTFLLGLFISGVFPSMLAYTEDLLDYKGCATTVLVTSASTGEMLLQLLVGSLIQSQGSYNFLLLCTIASLIGFCLFMLLLYIQHRHRKHTAEGSPENMKIKEKSSTAYSEDQKT
ncbi:major facilitator superfamily domain-containing protein 4A-like [Cynoglossus semilaevis]|uniref:Major facilitator superfamily domain-containing protein 4A n=1 Tax=Cynoglossus semilaevis TaxID=244447 RepID=A0A3P8WDD0_CYNSE|nr:major facilitator superfamily domain-containing protein 4A-like [Cynoglossus semilaevis]